MKKSRAFEKNLTERKKKYGSLSQFSKLPLINQLLERDSITKYLKMGVDS